MHAASIIGYLRNCRAVSNLFKFNSGLTADLDQPKVVYIHKTAVFCSSASPRIKDPPSVKKSSVLDFSMEKEGKLHWFWG